MRTRALLPRALNLDHVPLCGTDQYIYDDVPLGPVGAGHHVAPAQGQVASLEEDPLRTERLDPPRQILKVCRGLGLADLDASLGQDEPCLGDIGREDGGEWQEVLCELLDSLFGEKRGSRRGYHDLDACL